MIALLAAGVAALEFYLGTWRCAVTPSGQAPFRAEVVWARDASMLRTTVIVPAHAGHDAFQESQLTMWDEARGRFVQTTLGSDGSWSVSEAAPWRGSVEVWIDTASSDGRLTREELERFGRDRYVVRNFATLEPRDPAVVSDCTRR